TSSARGRRGAPRGTEGGGGAVPSPPRPFPQNKSRAREGPAGGGGAGRTATRPSSFLEAVVNFGPEGPREVEDHRPPRADRRRRGRRRALVGHFVEGVLHEGDEGVAILGVLPQQPEVRDLVLRRFIDRVREDRGLLVTGPG